VHVVRHGRLAGAGVIPPDSHAREYVDQLRLTSESVSPGLGPTPAATAEETEKILRWLESPGIRLVHVEGEWTCPVRSASRHLAAHDAVEQSRLSLVPFDERRSLPTVHQPPR
jgi:DNA polymerase-3 subunit epsilon